MSEPNFSHGRLGNSVEAVCFVHMQGIEESMFLSVDIPGQKTDSRAISKLFTSTWWAVCIALRTSLRRVFGTTFWFPFRMSPSSSTRSHLKFQ